MKTLLSKKTILSTLLALAILCGCTVSFFAVSISKNDFFSVERPFSRISSKSYNENWISDPFIVPVDQLELYRSVYNDSTLSAGNAYQVRNVNGEEQVVCLSISNYSCYSVAGIDLYLASGKNVYLIDLNSLSSELVYEGDAPISQISATENLAFFKAGDSVYRYYAPTDSVVFIRDIGEAADWFPVSNQTICILTENPDYQEALQVAKCSLNEKISDPSIFEAWINKKLNIDACKDYSISEYKLTTVLSYFGIDQYTAQWYNAVEDRIYDSYVAPEQEGLSGITVASAVETRSVYSGIDLMWEFPAGKYFSQDKDNGCMCHLNGGACISPCNCLYYDGGRQCNGYARKMFYMYSGQSVESALSLGVEENWSLDDMSEEILHAFLSHYAKPLFTRVITSYGYSHYILISEITENGIYYHEANVQHNGVWKCRVSPKTFVTYSELRNKYSKIVDIACTDVPHTHFAEDRYTSNYHYAECWTCSVQMSERIPHTLNLAVSADGHQYFCFCGYEMELENHIYEENPDFCDVCGW